MNENVMNATVRQNLTEVWIEAKQESIIHFLRRALNPEQTLAQLVAALRFAGGEASLAGISLRDVLGGIPSPSEGRPAAVSALPVTPPRRRQRRSSAALEDLKIALLDQLGKAPAGVSTPQLLHAVRHLGHDVDGARLVLILGKLQKQGELESDFGRPKTWRLKVRGRSVPEPVIIRKARPSEASEGPAAAPAEEAPVAAPAPEPSRRGGLMSPDEIKAAAAALQEKFFAAHARS